MFIFEQNAKDLKKYQFILEFCFWNLILTGAAFYFFQQQPTVSYQDCELCDGNQYLTAYQYFRGETVTYQVNFPYHSRILTPFLAAQLPFENPIDNFECLNLILSFLIVNLLLWFWQQLSFSSLWRNWGIFWLIFHWVGILRLNLLDPLTVDLGVYFFEIILLILLYFRKYAWLLLVTPLATIEKESFLALMVILMVYVGIYEYVQSKKWSKFVLLFVLTTFLGFLSKGMVEIFFTGIGTEGKNSIATLLFHSKNMLIEPLNFVRWLLAFLTGYGILSLLLFLPENVKRYLEILQEKEKLEKQFWLIALLVLSISGLLLGVTGGREMTRIQFLAYPIVMTFLLYFTSQLPLVTSIFIALASFPLMRLFQPIPEAIIFWQVAGNWYPDFMSLGDMAAWGIYFGFCGVVLALMAKVPKVKKNSF